jgi:Fe-Mn family superoxide dismutase
MAGAGAFFASAAGAGQQTSGSSSFSSFSANASSGATSNSGDEPSPFTQLKLPYSYDALEPHIDAKTMEIHYSKHHAAYTKNFNAALADNKITTTDINEIFRNISKYPAALRNNGGGFYNHNLYWSIMAPKAGGEPSGNLANRINNDFGSFAKFKEDFSKSGMGQFGSGWAWLIVKDGKLQIVSTPNQDNPLMDISAAKGIPLLNMDVWEHAYYLNYQNRRADYIAAFWNVINWKQVEINLSKAS